MSEISLKDISIELGVDKIITGNIIESRMAHNRTIHWWRSVISTKVRIVNCQSEEIEWEETRKTSKNLSSQYSTAGINAKKVVKRIKKTYLRNL